MSLNKVKLFHIKYALKMKNSCCGDYLIPSNVSSKYIKTILWPEVEHNDEDEDIFF